jgi:hypothetical protein
MNTAINRDALLRVLYKGRIRPMCVFAGAPELMPLMEVVNDTEVASPICG